MHDSSALKVIHTGNGIPFQRAFSLRKALDGKSAYTMALGDCQRAATDAPCEVVVLDHTVVIEQSRAVGIHN